MRAVSVDPATRTATVQGGARLRDLDAASQAHGLATTAGIYRDTGVAGLALGGGVGMLMRRFGLTCDNVLAAEVVTADGQVLEASQHEHPELFWALRGGGGNFGVVTRLDFQLHPLTHVFGGRVVYPFEDVVALGRFYRDLMADAPDELQAYLTYSTGDGEHHAVSLRFARGGRGHA
jgi:FAD/FMN-containing dehydrogenase